MVGGLVHRRLSPGFGWPSTTDPVLAAGGGHPPPPFSFLFLFFSFSSPLLLLPLATVSVMVARPTKGGQSATSFPPQPTRVAELPRLMPSRRSVRPQEERPNAAPLLSPFLFLLLGQQHERPPPAGRTPLDNAPVLVRAADHGSDLVSWRARRQARSKAEARSALAFVEDRLVAISPSLFDRRASPPISIGPSNVNGHLV